MLKLIIFDWDDLVVFGAKEGYFSCYHDAISSVGISLPEEEERKRIIDKWSKTNLEEIKELLKEHPSLVNKAYKNFEKSYWGDGFTKHLRVADGTKEILAELDKNYLLAVATSGNAEIITKKIIPTFGIPNVFSPILSSEQMGNPQKMKPHPLILLKIMKELEVSPEETIYTGDSPTDVEMAFRAGVEPVAVLSGHLDQETAKRMGVKKILPDITYLKQIL